MIFKKLLVHWNVAIDHIEQTLTKNAYKAIWCLFEELSEFALGQLEHLL